MSFDPRALVYVLSCCCFIKSCLQHFEFGLGVFLGPRLSRGLREGLPSGVFQHHAPSCKFQDSQAHREILSGRTIHYQTREKLPKEKNILSEVAQSQKNTHVMPSLISGYYTRSLKTQDTIHRSHEAQEEGRLQCGYFSPC
ncbi:hypothetical protein, unlikely [Trypanosoma congolense IL3000]|uniref:Uncharacterized protein n=1 Tax=Trypanosoma congolense (strain IL3000) TaxID=1068625 RepID=F9W655_TRYCI|nr:hypothetical protein, unlikely [Trypanosoma congolense IL3000]